MKFIFLDFDGVLHPFFPLSDRTDEENQHFAYRAQLESVLREYPAWKIVISSSWRKTRTLNELKNLFAPDIADRIVGVTPLLESYIQEPFSRYEEIQRWLRGTPDAQWIALDDDMGLFPSTCANLLICHDGFRERETRLLRERLNETVLLPKQGRSSI